jgi:hypothetical protein
MLKDYTIIITSKKMLLKKIITFRTPFSFSMTRERPSSITFMPKLKIHVYNTYYYLHTLRLQTRAFCGVHRRATASQIYKRSHVYAVFCFPLSLCRLQNGIEQYLFTLHFSQDRTDTCRRPGQVNNFSPLLAGTIFPIYSRLVPAPLTCWQPQQHPSWPAS